MGKGSNPRPFSVDRETFDSNWQCIFGNNEPGTGWDHYSDLPSTDSYQDDFKKDDETCNG